MRSEARAAARKRVAAMAPMSAAGVGSMLVTARVVPSLERMKASWLISPRRIATEAPGTPCNTTSRSWWKRPRKAASMENTPVTSNARFHTVPEAAKSSSSQSPVGITSPAGSRKRRGRRSPMTLPWSPVIVMRPPPGGSMESIARISTAVRRSKLIGAVRVVPATSMSMRPPIEWIWTSVLRSTVLAKSHRRIAAIIHTTGFLPRVTLSPSPHDGFFAFQYMPPTRRETRRGEKEKRRKGEKDVVKTLRR
jgi:hypothetical protein